MIVVEDGRPARPDQKQDWKKTYQVEERPFRAALAIDN
jgi:hypothetical protein